MSLEHFKLTQVLLRARFKFNLGLLPFTELLNV